jgi:GNAT superfamily N-acetyltransferase
MKGVLITLRELRGTELGEAAHLLGRAMCDNPTNVRVFRITASERRARALERFFGPVLGGLHQRGLIYGAFHEGSLVGVCGMARPAFCQPTVLEKFGIVPSVVLGNPAGTILRVMTWAGEWARRDLAEPHWHLGPVAVDPQLQSQGVGTAMLTAFCSRMDDLSMLSYLETDKYENVCFYRKLGFDVLAEAEVHGVPNWFMSRPGGTLKMGRRPISSESVLTTGAELIDLQADEV